MNFLQLVQFVQGNIGTSTDLPFAGPSTIVNATGQYLEFVNFVQQAYKAIQLDQENWKWRTKKAMIGLVAGQNIYTLQQIQLQVPDWEEIVHMHFIDDSRYSLTAIHQTAPANTVTVGAITQGEGTYNVTVANPARYAPFQNVFVNGVGATIAGPLQSVNGSVLSFAIEEATVTGSPLLMNPGTPVSYIGLYAPQDVASQQFCFFMEYQNWRGWKDRSTLPLSRPVYYTRNTSGALEFNPVPDSANSPYIFLTDYRVSIEIMNQTDSYIPILLPAMYHEAICWKAIMYWCISRKQGDRYAASEIEYKRIMSRMYVEQLPDTEPYLMELYS